jgi:predicted acetyltransferase
MPLLYYGFNGRGREANRRSAPTAPMPTWWVKLIDVYHAFDRKNLLLSNCEFPVTMEVFRAGYHKSFQKP